MPEQTPKPEKKEAPKDISEASKRILRMSGASGGPIVEALRLLDTSINVTAGAAHGAEQNVNLLSIRVTGVEAKIDGAKASADAAVAAATDLDKRVNGAEISINSIRSDADAAKGAADAALSKVNGHDAVIAGIPSTVSTNVSDLLKTLLTADVPVISAAGVKNETKSGAELVAALVKIIKTQAGLLNSALVKIKSLETAVAGVKEIGAITGRISGIEAVLAKIFDACKAAFGDDLEGAAAVKDTTLATSVPLVISALKAPAEEGADGTTYTTAISEVAEAYGTANVITVLNDLAADPTSIKAVLADEAGASLEDLDLPDKAALRQKIEARTDILARRAGECVKLLAKDNATESV